MDIYWKSAVSDNFATPGDWSSDSVPSTFDIAKMTVAGTYTITANAFTHVFGITTGSNTTLSIQSSEFIATEGTPTGANRGTISIGNGASFESSGPGDTGGIVDNIGHIVLNASGTPTGFAANVLEGGGDVSLSDDPNNLVDVGTNVDNTISGAGSINGSMQNQALGVIIASGANPLKLTGPVTNAGLLKASGGTLEIDADVTNTATGIIEAVPGSTVDLGNTQPIVIIGGSLKADSGGEFVAQVNTNATFDGSGDVVPTNKMLTISGQLTMQSGSDITLKGTINNTGEILTNGSNGLFVGAAGTLKSVTLEGKGMVSLSSTTTVLITGIIGEDTPVVTLINVNNDIFGQGTIGGNNMALSNEAGGTIDADVSVDKPLIIDTGLNVITNAGSMNADAGALLFINSPVSNTGKMNSFGSTIIAAGKVTGTGTATINLDGVVEFGAASSNGTKFATGSTGELILDDSKQYTGTISGFGANITQSIDLTDLTDVNPSSVTKSFAGGILTINDGAGDVARIKFSGTYTLASFHLANDGNGGILVTDPPVSKPQTSSTPQGGLLGLLGNYIASSFVSNSYGHNGSPTLLAAEPLLAQPISLPHA